MTIGEELEQFEQECKEWLYPLGYTVHSFSGNRTSFIFTDHNHEHKPSINCIFNGGEKRCELSCSLPKLFLTMESGQLQFKHPDIEKWIETMEWYSRLCKDFTPIIHK